MTFFHKRKKITSFQIILFGFISVILTGAGLLMLPISARNGQMTNFWDALFTATSAVCVTGLVVQDTATYWSAFGQGIILVLIQIGGMGVVTVAVCVAVASGRKIGLMQRSTMQEAIAAPQVGGSVKMTEFILKTTVLIEGLGAVCLFPVFRKEFGLGKGIWYALFHSVSAFCNAGFDLMGEKEAFSSLTSYVDNPVVNLTIMLLIVIGGIGFMTWEDVKSNRWHIQKYRMQSKVVFTVTGILLGFPFLYFYFREFSHMTGMQRFWMAAFQTVTPRTAGFNTADLASMSEPGQLITILLMLIGGSPGSTAGGMKTTTIAVLAASALAVFLQNEETHLFRRRVVEGAVRNAATILMMYFVLFFAGGIIISSLEQLPVLPCLFETASALGTVGLTLGITTKLGLISRLLLIVFMFFGRVGGLTIIFAAISSGKKSKARLPRAKITVG